MSTYFTLTLGMELISIITLDENNKIFNENSGSVKIFCFGG